LLLFLILQALVEQEMTRVYGQDTIAAVVMIHDTAALDAAAAQYCKLQEQFEDVLDWYQSRLPPTAVEAAGGAADVEAAAGEQQSGGSGAYKRKKDGLKRKTVSCVSWYGCLTSSFFFILVSVIPLRATQPAESMRRSVHPCGIMCFACATHPTTNTVGAAGACGWTSLRFLGH
jgi:hypothetical protein